VPPIRSIETRSDRLLHLHRQSVRSLATWNKVLYRLAGSPCRPMTRGVRTAGRCSQMCSREVAGRLETRRDDQDAVPRSGAAGEKTRDG
jgi:hypothetical protein